jgi:hypothetical protein
MSFSIMGGRTISYILRFCGKAGNLFAQLAQRRRVWRKEPAGRRRYGMAAVHIDNAGLIAGEASVSA